MKRLYVFIFSCFVSSFLFAQTYGNEWINYSQKYLRIRVVFDRIYRIDSTTIANGVAATGASLSSIDPRNFQLFHNGQEQYIWVEGESDGVFNSADYLEFYGQRNDGTMDSSLYGGAANQLDPHFSLFNDTSVYYLTWNSSTNNRRFVTTADTNFSSYTPANYFIDHELIYGTSEYLPGVQNSIGATDPDYISSEGYYCASVYYGQNVNFNFSSAHAFAGGPTATFQYTIGSHSDDWQTSNDNHIQTSFAGNLFDTIYDGYSVWHHVFNGIDPATLNSVSSPLTVSSINSSSSASSGRIGLAYGELQYPHTFDLESRYFWKIDIPDETSQAKAHLSMINPNSSAQLWVHDLFNHERTIAVFDGVSWNALVNNGNGTNKQVLISSQPFMLSISFMEPVNGNGTFTDFSTQAADSVYIIVTNSLLWNAATSYKNYRSGAGGNYNVVMANIDELTDQFAYGIEGSPLSIRGFCNFMISTYPSEPSNLLLLGKSYSPELIRWATHYSTTSLPTFGYPPSDNNFTAGLNGHGWEPAIPTGRISAYDSTEVMMYLNKVIEYESNAPAEWMKYVLHFGGGTDTGEQQQFAGYLANYADTIRDTLFGGIVLTYLKTSTAPIQINQSDSLRDRINAGVSIMTFFGHASGTSFDQSIDDPSTYNNAGKYPLLIANSCYAGNIHDIYPGSSELFTFLDQKGTIGYIASVGIGIPSYLNEYSGRLYRSIGKVNYGRTIGESIQWTVANTQQQTANNVMLKSTLKEMTFQGDPAVVINSFPDPDYVITNADVWFDQVTTPDSIYVYASIANIGKAIDTSFIVEMRRTFPNGDTNYYYQSVQAPHSRDTIMFRIPVDHQRGIGLNHIRIDVDHFHSVPEMLESNNTTLPDIDLLINGGAIIPVYPYEFAVIPADTITLKACTVDPLQPIKTYRFELDTTDLFNSPFRQTHIVNAPGGVVSWQPNLITGADSMVYFWRVSPDSITAADAFIWRQSSFQYITGQVGWGQDHIFQFTNDAYQYVVLNRQQRRFDFVNSINNLSVKNGIYFSAIAWNESWYKINQSTQHIFSCTAGFGGDGFSIAIIDPVSCKPRSYHDTLVGQEPGGYLDCVGANQVLNAFDFLDWDNTNQDLAANFIIDSIPNGSRVLIYSQDYPWYTRVAYNANLQNAFAQIGCDTIGTSLVPDTCAFIAWGVKGVPNSATEIVGPQISSILTLNDTMNTNWYQGIVQSPKIGPASNWGSFHWKQHTAELPDHDSVYVDLYGYNTSGNRVFITRFSETTTDVLNLNTIVDAASFPYIDLVASMRDDTAHTPAQLDRWHVLYTPAPDLAIDPPMHYAFHADTLSEGETAQFSVAVRNLTPWIFTDSMLYTYWIVDANHNTHNLPSRVRPAPFNGYAWLYDTLNFNTSGYPGINELWMEVNPIGHTQSQYEQFHFNNVIMVPFMVSTDKINPLLDVTFDGVHIMDGDIVSGKPQILVSLKDENQFLALNDTADFNLFLRTPSQSQPQLLYFSDPRLVFTPAQLPNNSCKILFSPVCVEDGIYELIVQAKDRSNNQSGLIDYNITFEVINHPSITNTMNYPNPFSTSTRFVFTLTGNEVPELFTIQIMTITGKVVREIDRNELGDIHIGRNITTYAWDGKDEYGDQLANGIYLYRVITKLDGQSIDHRESGADPYITQGWGKMYLMR